MLGPHQRHAVHDRARPHADRHAGRRAGSHLRHRPPLPWRGRAQGLTISDPPQTYYINAGTTRAANALYAEVIDYTQTVAAHAGATVTLAADPLDALEIQDIDANGAPLDAFDGQFVDMTVLSVDVTP